MRNGRRYRRYQLSLAVVTPAAACTNFYPFMIVYTENILAFVFSLILLSLMNEIMYRKHSAAEKSDARFDLFPCRIP